jgi:hypothetical protein
MEVGLAMFWQLFAGFNLQYLLPGYD